MTSDPVASMPCYCAALRKTTRTLSRMYDAAIEGSGLRITQYALMGAVRRCGEPTVQALAGAMSLERTALLRNLKPLVHEGLVEVAPQGGVKAHIVRLTPKGKALFNEVRPQWQKAQSAVENALTREEIEQLRSLLQRLESAVSA